MSMIHEITAGAPRYKKNLRKGRGESSGHGKTSGRGTKGAGARVGTYIKRGHEGGQTPLFRRLPTRGFSNFKFQTLWHIVNVAELEVFPDGATVDAAALNQAGLVRDFKHAVKILGDGKLTKKLTVLAGWFTKSAVEKINAAGGAAQNVKGEAFVFPKPKHRFVKREAPKKVAAEVEKSPEKAPEKEAAKPAETKAE